MKKILINLVENSNILLDKIFIHKNHLANITACIEDCTIGDSFLAIPYFDRLKNENIIIFGGKNLDIFRYFLPDIKSVEINAEPFARNPFYRYSKLKEAFGKVSGCKKTVVTSPHRTNRIVKAARILTSNEKYVYYGQKVISNYRDRSLDSGFNVIKNPYLDTKNNIDIHTEKHLRVLFNSAFHRKIELNEQDYINFYRKFREKDFYLKDYMVIVTDSAAVYRRFPMEKWQKVLDNIPKNRKIVAVGKTPIKLEHPNLLNMIGKTSLIDSMKLVQNADMVVGNETGLTHLGYMTGIPTVCIISGGQFGGFLPWNEFEGIVHNVYKDVECKGCNWFCKYVNVQKGEVPLCFQIEPEEVLEEIEKISCLKNK